jgi:uncharacterized membrane protein
MDPAPRSPRRTYLDWLRGLAVLIMIEAHVLDSWTRLTERASWQFAWSMILGGFGAPLFLFLAGVAVPLSAGSKSRTSDRAQAAKAVMRRGLGVFGLAFLFRIQAWILGQSAARRLLKVDILNIMGPSIMAAAGLWGAGRTVLARYIAFAAAMLAVTLCTPIVRTTSFLDALPDPIEAYLRPAGGLASFPFFPWAGFVFAGGLIGLALDGARSSRHEARLNWVFVSGGSCLAFLAYAGSFLPSPYERSEFWGSSPAFFFLRTGILVSAVGLSYLWESRRSELRWSPLRQLGRTSLFIYWIHVEMVYGLISLRIHKSLTLSHAWMAYADFCLFMLLCSIGKERFVDWWRRRRVTSSGGSARTRVSFGAR